MRLVLALLLLLPFASVAAAQDVAITETRTITAVAYHRTPGKPMAFFDRAKPAEDVRVECKDARFWLVVRVNVPREGVTAYSEERAEITAQEYDAIADVALELASWKPEPTGDRVANAGSEGFVLEGKANAQHWSGPIKNDDRPSKLVEALARLAKKHEGKLRLCYFGP